MLLSNVVWLLAGSYDTQEIYRGDITYYVFVSNYNYFSSCFRRALAIPPSTGPFSHDRCKMYSADFKAALAEGRTTPDDEWPVVPCQHGWEYNKSDVPYDTIASEVSVRDI